MKSGSTDSFDYSNEEDDIVEISDKGVVQADITISDQQKKQIVEEKLSEIARRVLQDIGHKT